MKIILILIVTLMLSACANESMQGVSTKELRDQEMAKALAAHNETLDEEDRIVCKRIQKTGTRFTQKVCRTVRQIKQSQEASRQTVEAIQLPARRGGVEGN